MTNKRTRKKFNRATVPVQVGNGLVNVPIGQKQGVLGQTFYGSNASIPTGQTTAFSPGVPLYPQPSVDLKGRPFAFQFPIAVNTFQPDRTLGDRDIPSFEQLRMLAKLYNGVTLCERAWFDMVPRMKLNIGIKPEYISAGADPKQYQTEMTYFLNWFESPDKIHDLHSWIRIALREQTQIDELYIYKRRKRNGSLHALEIIDGSQMKPLLDDWGRQPKHPQAFVQQYPWGIPGAWFTTRDMIHYQETPRVESPYGMSRVERIIMLVNQALRKQKKDLSNFTDGNIPQGYMMVPETATWTPDQIDAFEQSWNALLAGSPSQQVRIRFTQPGMKYEPFEQYALDPTFDKFLINICVSAYGLSMQDVAFTEDIHKSSGNFQENVTYRRTIDPLATIYAMFLTNIVNHEFPSELHGEMFQVTFGGYDEEEDVSEMAGAYTQLVQSGVLGVTAAGKLMKLPDDPNAPYIGRVLMTKDGPVFLDDIATDKMRTAAAQAQLASFQAIATSPQQQAQVTNQQPASYAIPSQQKMFDQSQYSNKQQDTNRAVASDENQYDDYLDYEDNEEFDIDPAILLDEEFDPDQELENEIQLLLNSDKDEPFSNLERTQSGVDFSIKKNIIKAKALVEVAMKHLQTARKNFMNAPLEHKDMAKQSILSARQQLHDAKITLEAYKEQAKRTNDMNDTSLRASAIEERQHIIKIAASVKTKAAYFVSKAQLKAQIAAANAAHASAKHLHKTEFEEASKNAACANVIQSLVNTIASKVVLYNMLASRTVQKFWTKEDANESYFVSQDLKNIANLIIEYQDSADLSNIVNEIRMLLYTLLGQESVSPRRLRVLEKLLQKLQTTIKESESKKDENAIQQEKRYTISEIIELFSQQMQNEKANQKNEQDIRRPEENVVAERTARDKEISADYRRWRDRAIEDVKSGRNFRGFTTILIPEHIHRYISDELIECTTTEEVKLVFQKAKDLERVEHA